MDGLKLWKVEAVEGRSCGRQERWGKAGAVEG
mgnify:CR=1 FL=1